MSDSLGEKLRAAREDRGISISEVAEQTRIAPMYIECIEADNYKPLPGGIFNKGFVKSYARFIGFDEQEALRDYSQIVARTEGTDDDPLKSYRPEVLTDDSSRQSTLPTIIFAGIILALMTGGILFLVNFLQNRSATPDVSKNTSNAIPNQGPESQSNALADSPPVPTMQNLRVEFRSVSEPISLSTTADGKTSVNTISPGTGLSFEPKESLRLSYSRSLASSAQLLINGKPISLPSEPENPRRAAIEIELNKDNLQSVWNSGKFTFGTAAPAAVETPQVSTSPTRTPETAASITPRPSPAASVTPKASPLSTSTVKPTPTPIVVGRPANANRPRISASPSPN